MLGILLAKKPSGITSHDAVDRIRRRFSTRRVGHAGTLDPLATGLLVMAVGPATRFLQYLPLEPKEYVGDVVFGETRDSYDAEGEVTSVGAPPTDLQGELKSVIPSFLGLIEQLPPMHSAVKIGGKKLYQYARQGEEVKREPRTIHLSEIDVEGVSGNTARLRIVCSGGTYIRTLAHDLGQAIGCGAYLGGLLRTRVGRFHVEEAVELDESDRKDLTPLREALRPMPMVQLDEAQVRAIREGRAIEIQDSPPSELVGLLEESQNVFSVARVMGSMVQPECVIPAEAFDAAS